MATATKERRKARPKQTTLNIGIQDGQIKELEDLGDELDEVRSERIVKQAEEKNVQDRLIECMKKHKVKTYKYQDKTLVLEHDEKDKVKVKKPKATDDGADFGDEEGD